MTLEQMYSAIGGDYKAVMERLPSADFVRRFALKFLQDDSFPNLKKALEAQDAPTAFRAAHTLKGVCQNLGFDALYAPASALTGSTPRRHAGRRRYPLPSRGEGVSAGRGGVERIGVNLAQPLPLGEVARQSRDGEGKPVFEEYLHSDKHRLLSELILSLCFLFLDSVLALSVSHSLASSPKGRASSRQQNRPHGAAALRGRFILLEEYQGSSVIISGLPAGPRSS